MLWLSLYLPHLPLEVFLRGGAQPGPLAVLATHSNRQTILARNRAAAAHGITPGMPLGAALSLCADLVTHPREEGAEGTALEGLALWAEQFTPTLSLALPAALLLEVEGSLKLFGGVEALRERIDSGVTALGYRARLALAPSPLGAWLLAQAGQHQSVLNRGELEQALSPLPLGLLDLPKEKSKALRGMGLYTLGDCLRLPRDGAAKRLGPEFLAALDRALGRVPDPLPLFTPPARFHSRIALPAEVENAEALLFAARRLLLEMQGFLLARSMGVQTFELYLTHHHRPPSRLPVGLVAPTREIDHLLGLLKELLGRFELPAPVDGLVLTAEQFVPLASHNKALFNEPKAEQQGWQQLVERLRARLGEETVKGIQPVADHRPERAWRTVVPGQAKPLPGVPSRPLWLLPEPELLKEVDGHPWHGGRLVLQQGPERIESGWWDGPDMARDYFVAANPRHGRYWVYRECRPPRRWFLHGVFS